MANAALVLLFTFSWLVKAQDDLNPRQTGNLRVEVETNKTTYALENPFVSQLPCEIGQHDTVHLAVFHSAYRGIAGLYVSVKQLTGKQAGEACEGNGDRYMDKTPERGADFA